MNKEENKKESRKCDQAAESEWQERFYPGETERRQRQITVALPCLGARSQLEQGQEGGVDRARWAELSCKNSAAM